MKATNRIQRFLALAMALIMVIGLLPVSIHAEENGTPVDAAVIFSDLHTSKSDYKESTVKNVFTTLKNTGLPISSVTSAGDAFSVNADSTKYTGDPTKITGYIQSALGDTSIPVNYVWSDHDRYATGIEKTSGLIEYENYYIYKLSMGDLCSYDRYKAGFNYTQSSNSTRVNAGFTATVPQAIAEFQAAAETMDKSKPLFIVSHQPLFDNRNDNAWAEDWFDAINAVAAEMDVAFFYGHNHKYDNASDYYYAKGSELPVATADNWGFDYDVGEGYLPSMDLSSKSKTLNFTHMCAGYLAPSSTGSTSSTTREGTVMAITIYEDSIRYTTYNSSGIYTGNYAVDKYVTRDHAATEPELVVSGTEAYFVGSELDITVGCKTGSQVEDVTALAELTGFDMNAAGDYTVTVSYAGLTAQLPIMVREKRFTDAATGVCVEVEIPGATALTVGSVSSGILEQVEGMLSSTVAYDVSLTGFGEGGAVVTLPVPAGVDTPVVCRIGDDGIVRRVQAEITGSTASFAVDSFGIFLIGQEEITEELQNTVIGGGTSYEEKTVYVPATSFVSGGKYLIVGESKVSGGDKLAYQNNDGSEGWVVVTPDADGNIELDDSSLVWTATGSDNNVILSNDGRYIGGTDAKTLKSKESEAVKVTYDSGATRLKTASGTTRYLYYSTYNSENWKWSTSSSSSSSSRAMYIYKEETVRIQVSAPVTYTLTAGKLHQVLSTDTAELSFELLADGVAAELPEGASWRFEVTNDRFGIIESIDGEGVITFTGEVGSCYVKICCDLAEGTVYKYVKVSTEADPNACDHVYTAETFDATCTEDGCIVYTCVCGDSYTEVIPALGHTYESAVTAPTCTAEGYTTYTCACGDSYVADRVAALGHSYETVVTAPTCTSVGYTTYICFCGDTYVADETAALGHSYESVKTEPTCTVDGSIVYTCFCGESYTEVIPAKGHDYKTVVTAPTCTEAGYTTYRCACGDSYVADLVDALGHTYESVKTEPTCTVDGSIVYTCFCGETYTEVIPAKGHDYKTVVTAPTCTEAGYTTYRCACGDSYKADYTGALGHKHEAVVTVPTCETAGYTTYTCFCGDSYVADEVAALGHALESVKTEATCETAGYTTHTCLRCGQVTVDGHVAALGHDVKTVTVDATCTTDGSVTETCVRCGETEIVVLPALGHSFESVKTDATCTVDGSIVYTCFCGETYTEVIPAKGHIYESLVTAPSCTEGGYTTYTCSCGDSYVADETAALGHRYESVKTEPTCTENGSIVYTCVCGETYSESIPALGHSYEAVVTAPTCTAEGYTTYTCACGDSYTADVVAALGHSYTAETTAPTCTTAGATVYTCHCGDSYTADVVAALGHDLISVVTEATCETAGYTTHTCVRCGQVTVDGHVAALGHDVKTVTVDATCTADGSVTKTCVRCGETEIVVLPALGHSFESVKTEATCTTDGSIVYTCFCGEIYTEVIPALGHDYEVVVTAPTCTEGGYTTYTCFCGDSYVADETAALGHSYESVKTEPTCTENGSIVYTCVCGETYSESIPALGHSYEAVVTAPTCTEQGYTTYTCVCGHSYTADVVAALGHSYTTTEQNGILIHTCACGHSYTESVAWISVGSGWVLDTDGIEIGSEHKYIVVAADKDYALTVDGSSVSATAVTIQGNTLTANDTSRMELWFADNGSRESKTYLLTQDGSKSVYHVSGNINYGHDSKGYWYIGSSSNGQYQLYDYDNCNWYLNYGYVWGNESASRFAVSYNTRTVRLFTESNGYARLTGDLIQTVSDADGATVASILEKISIQFSANGSDVTGTDAVTADMLTWSTAFDGTTPGTYTAKVTYQGVELGTVTVTVTSKHTYEINVVEPTCTEGGYTERMCTTCGVSSRYDYTEALGHSYTHADADGYRVYTCTVCGHSYSEKLVSSYDQDSSFTAGDRFVITVKSSSKYYALSHSGNSISAVQVTVSNGQITSEITEDLLWSYNDGKLSYVSNGATYYLYTYSSGWWWNSTSTLGISTGESADVSISGTKLMIGSKYLRYSSSKLSLSSSAGSAYIFREN